MIDREKWQRLLTKRIWSSAESNVSKPEDFSLGAFTPSKDELRITLAGHISVENASRLHEEITALVKTSPLKKVTVDMGRVTYFDSSGVAILLDLNFRCTQSGGTLQLTNVPAPVHNLLAPVDFSTSAEKSMLEPLEEPHIVLQVGAGVEELLENIHGIVTFVASATSALIQDLLRPWAVKWDNIWKLIEKCGSDAVPIVLVLSFLQGTILAFQAAIQLRKFGANLFVADLVSVAICLEMGPLMVALIVCGRSGAAFAAQIGTMQVTEEIDALRVMAIDPVRYLVSPRILAVAFVLPCLTLFADVLGVLGGCVVAVASLDLTPTAYFNQVHRILEVSDVVKGLVKSIVFGFEIALVGCMRGFQVRGGAESVGNATTSAVVTCIFLLTVTDAFFALFYHYLPKFLPS